jgi:hypothetical protein
MVIRSRLLHKKGGIMLDSNEIEYPVEATLGDQWRRGKPERPPQTAKVLAFPVSDVHRLVSCLAYEIYLKRGKLQGHDLDDWLAAEAAVLSQLTRCRKPTGVDPNGKETK